MMKEHSTKKSLKASGLALMLCIAMLIGTTFAWFTDSITNSGNVIQSGTLDISGTVASVDPNATNPQYTIEGINGGRLFGFGTPLDLEAKDEQGQSVNKIINESLWEPGKSNAKLLTVTNKGSLAAKIKLSFDIKDDGLQNALWFDFVQVNEGGQVTGEFTKREMSTLKTFVESVEFPLASNNSLRFILVYGMKEEAGNEYQGRGFEADVSIVAKQDTVEQDGFGSDQYDKGAFYPTDEDASAAGNTASVGSKYYKTVQGAVNATNSGESVKLIADTALTQALLISADNDVVLDLNNHELSNPNGIAVYLDGGTATLKNGSVTSATKHAIYAKGKSVIKELNINMDANSWGIYLKDEARIEKITGGTYKANIAKMASFPLYISTNARIDEISGGDFEGSKAAIANYGSIGKITGGTFHGTYYDGTTPTPWLPDYAVMYNGKIDEISGGTFFEGKTSVAQNMTVFNSALEKAGCELQKTNEERTIFYRDGKNTNSYTGFYYNVVKR